LAPIGSLTKAFTATAIGELVAEGKMDWNETPVNTYLPEFQLKDPVLTSQLTLVDLLSHRTVSLPGLYNGEQFAMTNSQGGKKGVK
jgi:CubicO group peptidase (beta-lactamase class C family)